MAHLEKLTKGSLQGLTIHVERKSLNHSNKEINNEKSHLNYSLLNDNSDAMTRLNKRLENVHMMNRKNVNAACSWVVSLPKELEKKSDADKDKFFAEVHEFMTGRYGGIENVLYSEVHNDETTPHLHFAFVPVVWDEKNNRNKVSAKDVINRNELKIFHTELDKHLKSQIPEIYKKGILNDKTLPFDDVKEIKLNKVLIAEVEEKAKKLNDTLDPLRNEYKMKREYLNKINRNSEHQMYSDTVKSSRTIFGKDIVTLPKQEYENLFVSWSEMKAFNDSKNNWDARLENYQGKDFWKEYSKLQIDNYDLREHINTLESQIDNDSDKVMFHNQLNEVYKVVRPFIDKHFNKIMSLAERLPVARDFVLGFVAGSKKYRDFNSSLIVANGSHESGFDFVKDSLDLVSRTQEKEPTQSVKRFRGPSL